MANELVRKVESVEVRRKIPKSIKRYVSDVYNEKGKELEEGQKIDYEA